MKNTHPRERVMSLAEKSQKPNRTRKLHHGRKSVMEFLVSPSKICVGENKEMKILIFMSKH